MNEKTSEAVYENASAQLNSAEFSTQKLLTKMKVKVVCTTDEPTDSLEHHKEINR